jgi:CelD/BcsL family acetyltransferase involved in cellulose biosynthesis
VCPVIPLNGDPEIYLRSLSPRVRQHLRYYRRRLEKSHVVAATVVTGGASLASDVDDFLRVYRSWSRDRPVAADLLGERFAAFRRDVIVRFAERGRLLLGLLRIDDHPVAAELSFGYGGTCYDYNTCYDPAWKREHVRLLSQWEVIRRAIAVGYREFDCLRGSEAYKYQWGAQPRRHVRIRVERRTRKLRLLEETARLMGRRRTRAVATTPSGSAVGTAVSDDDDREDN